MLAPASMGTEPLTDLPSGKAALLAIAPPICC